MFPHSWRWLDILFPARTTELCVRDCNSLNQTKRIVGLTTHIHSYQHEDVKSSIAEAKFYQNTQAAKLLAQSLTLWIQEQPGPVVFIPMPLSKKRERQRRYNQVTFILNQLPQTNHQLSLNILLRPIHTKQQAKLSKAERIQNVKGVFSANPEMIREDTTYVLLDDVITTGATMNEARATLAPHIPPSSKLLCLALAH